MIEKIMLQELEMVGLDVDYLTIFCKYWKKNISIYRIYSNQNLQWIKIHVSTQCVDRRQWSAKIF